MSNESPTPGPAAQPRPSLPQFDPNRQDTQALPASAPTSELPVTPPSTPYTYAAMPAPQDTAPVAGSSDATGRWSAKKTAVTAGLAIVLASAGAIGAAAAMPAGSTGGDSLRGPGGGRSLQFPGGGNGQGGFGRQNQQLPNLQNGAPGGAQGGIDPNQLSQLDPQDLLNQLDPLDPLDQGVDPFTDGSSGNDGTDGTDDPGQGTDGAKTT
ncbi:MAG: hypothetical protein ACKOVB_15850 [Terrabacter sp.]